MFFAIFNFLHGKLLFRIILIIALMGAFVLQQSFQI